MRITLLIAAAAAAPRGRHNNRPAISLALQPETPPTRRARSSGRRRRVIDASDLHACANQDARGDRLSNNDQHQYKRRGPRLRVLVGLANTTSERQRPRVGVASKEGDIIHLSMRLRKRDRALYHHHYKLLRRGQGRGSEGERGPHRALLELLAPWIERKLSGEVGPALCTTLKPLVDTNLATVDPKRQLTNNCAMNAWLQ